MPGSPEASRFFWTHRLWTKDGKIYLGLDRLHRGQLSEAWRGFRRAAGAGPTCGRLPSQVLEPDSGFELTHEAAECARTVECIKEFNGHLACKLGLSANTDQMTAACSGLPAPGPAFGQTDAEWGTAAVLHKAGSSWRAGWSYLDSKELGYYLQTLGYSDLAERYEKERSRESTAGILSAGGAGVAAGDLVFGFVTLFAYLLGAHVQIEGNHLTNWVIVGASGLAVGGVSLPFYVHFHSKRNEVIIAANRRILSRTGLQELKAR